MGERASKTSEISDVDLIARSAKQPGVFGELFERHYADVHRYLARRIGERADDLASQTFIVAFERRGSFEPETGEVRSWLFGIATHLLWNERRAEQRLLRLTAQIQSEPVSAPASLAAERWEIDAALARALTSLDGDQRDVLLLTAWGELSYDEIAVAMSIPVGTVRSRLSRARAAVRAELESVPTQRVAAQQRRADHG